MSDEPPLAVRRDGPGHYLVKSQRAKSDDWYAVSFAEPGFPAGHCTCDDFSIRIESAINRHDEPPRWICKHVARCLEVLQHARELCDAIGVPFHPRIIPSFHD